MIQLYTWGTPNGQKVSIALEELQVPYEVTFIDITKGQQFAPEYIKLNPNSKIPAIVDTEGPGGQPLAIMESGAILIYLADKYGKLLAKDPVERSETLQWLFFQVGHIGPMFGQFGHFFKYAREKCDHPYPLERYSNETRRLLKVLDNRLQQTKSWISREFSIADIAICPWVDCLDQFYQATNILGLDEFSHVQEWRKRFNERPAVRRGAKI